MRETISRALAVERRRFVIGFVASTIYAHLPPLIREFRRAAPDVDMVLVELVSLEQIAALKDGRINIGFGRVRFEDDAVKRTVLRNEALVAALPAAHPLAVPERPISLARIAEFPHIIYPSRPRPGYADQVLSLFHDHGLEPRIAHEARELQIAIGLVAAEEGICIVPERVDRSRVDGVIYRELSDPATSPIIMSHRVEDSSADVALMGSIIARMYREWGYAVPDALKEYEERLSSISALHGA